MRLFCCYCRSYFEGSRDNRLHEAGLSVPAPFLACACVRACVSFLLIRARKASPMRCPFVPP